MAQLLIVPERRLVSISSTATSQIGRAGLVEELRRIPGAPDPVLLETLPKGVAFHHAGLALSSLPFPLQACLSSCSSAPFVFACYCRRRHGLPSCVDGTLSSVVCGLLTGINCCPVGFAFLSCIPLLLTLPGQHTLSLQVSPSAPACGQTASTFKCLPLIGT